MVACRSVHEVSKLARASTWWMEAAAGIVSMTRTMPILHTGLFRSSADDGRSAAATAVLKTRLNDSAHLLFIKQVDAKDAVLIARRNRRPLGIERQGHLNGLRVSVVERAYIRERDVAGDLLLKG